MEKKILNIIVFVAIYLFVIQYSNSKKNEDILTLLDIEKLGWAENVPIDYYVPDQSNNPKECTMEIWVDGSVSGSEGSVSGHYKKVAGMKNFCKQGKSGCNPYNCHQRVY